MKKSERQRLEDNFIEEKLAEAFGFQEEQLAEEIDHIKEQAEGDVPKAPEWEFQKILNRIERENAPAHKVIRVDKLIKVMVAAATLGALMLGGGIWAGAKKYYVYEVSGRTDLDNVIVLNNNEGNLVDKPDTMSEVKAAYEQIKDELNINVLELSYLPENFTFIELDIRRGKSKIEFSNTFRSLFFYQGLRERPSSFSYTSDMKEFQRVKNQFLNKELVIYRKELEEGEIEFSVRIIEGNQYYIVEGIIDEAEFVEIVRGIKMYSR